MVCISALNDQIIMCLPGVIFHTLILGSVGLGDPWNIPSFLSLSHSMVKCWITWFKQMLNVLPPLIGFTCFICEAKFYLISL